MAYTFFSSGISLLRVGLPTVLGMLCVSAGEQSSARSTLDILVFSVLAKDAQETMRSSNPVMFVGRNLSATSRAAADAELPTTFDKSSMHEQAVADSLVLVRPGEPGRRPFWNVHSKCFTFAPALDFKEVPGAAGYRFTVKSKDFFDAAMRIAQTYVKTQQANGTWKLKLNAKTGEVLSRNDLVPIPMIELYERLGRQYDRQEFRTLMTVALDWMMNNTAKQFNFEAQFQDVPPMQDYTNLSGNRAGEMAAFLFRHAKQRPDLVSLAEEILRMEEDQFILWERPFDPNFFTPCGLEQYAYYVPVNYSAVVCLDACAAAYRATGKPLYLAKAITMLNGFTWIMDKSNGILPSLMKPGVDSLEGWPNCGGCSKILTRSIFALWPEGSVGSVNP